jgi:hypothetical protein
MRLLAAVVAMLALAPATAAAVTFPAMQELPVTGNVFAPSLRLAVTGDGTVLAGWEESEDASIPRRVEVSIRPPGGTFAIPQRLNPAARGALYWLGASPDGHAIALWYDYDDDKLHVAAAPPAGAFADAGTVPVAWPPSDYAESGRFAIAPDGTLAVLYPTHTSTEDTISAVLRDPGGIWSAPEKVTGVPAGPPGPRTRTCAVRFDGAGNLLAEYSSRAVDGGRLRTKYRPAGGGWVNELPFVPQGVSSECLAIEAPDHVLDVDADGRFATVWLDSTNDTYAAVRGPGPGGQWTSTLIGPDTSEENNLATDDAGHFTAVVSTLSEGVRIARYDPATGAWDRSTLFPDGNGDNVEFPQVAADRDSGEVVAGITRLHDGDGDGSPDAAEIVGAGADGADAPFGPLSVLRSGALFGASGLATNSLPATVASGGTWAIGFATQRGDGSITAAEVVAPGTVPPTPGPPGGGTVPPPPGGGGAPPPPSGGPVKLGRLVVFPKRRSCGRRAALRIRLRKPPAGLSIRSASIGLNHKRRKRVRGRGLRRPIVLHRLPRGELRITVTLKLSDGRKVSFSKRYAHCRRTHR